MRYFLPFILLIIACKQDNTVNTVSNKPISQKQILEKRFEHKLDSVAVLASAFTKKNAYNSQYIFIADLSMHSGLPRFAVVDINKRKAIVKDIVAHGSGTNGYAEKVVFSNTPNSLCSSKGKYKIGVKYNGNWGVAYKLFGLDATNNNAYERFIVLHAWDCVPDKYPYPDYICNSEGCPMVSYKFLKVLSSYIDKSKKPMLLWIID